MDKWSKTKPTTPGRYETRYNNSNNIPNTIHCVTVKSRGRGFEVIPDPPYKTRYAMSEIGEHELEWRRLVK